MLVDLGKKLFAKFRSTIAGLVIFLEDKTNDKSKKRMGIIICLLSIILTLNDIN